MHFFILLGLLAGFLSGLLGVGGGVILVPALTIYFKMGIKEAMGTSLAVIVFTAAIGAVRYHAEGLLSLNTVFYIVCGSLAGTMIGVYVNSRMSGDVLKIVFALFLIFVGGKMLWGTCARGMQVEERE